jgi:hypothetical protein
MMKRILLPALLLALGLAGCGGASKTAANDSASQTTPKVTVSALAAGSYSVILGDESAPQVGQYFSASDGTRLLIVNDDNALASAIYKGAADGSWQRIPAPSSDVSISFLRSDALTLDAIDLSALAGSYTTSVQGTATGFTLASSGTITAATDASCRLSGSVGADLVQGVRKLSLSASGCGSLPASLTGHLILDAAYAPVKLRLVLDDGSAISELWAYAE